MPMHPVSGLLAVALLLLLIRSSSGQPPEGPSDWTIYVTNDNCPDYTWGFTEEQTRQAFADIVRGHLDEMLRTDDEPPQKQSRYNMAVTQEALCFVERYPERRDELIRRIGEGRAFVSPYLCNSLWGFQSIEASIRTLMPACRLEQEWSLPPAEVAEHIEEPSLPWGVATILAGCGVRWLSNPFYGYDSTFSELTNPPLFEHEGPDGSRIRVVMDPWASGKWSYMQGGKLLRDPELIDQEWVPHYRSLGTGYPLRATLASGTHGDIRPTSGDQAREFSEAIVRLNGANEPHAKLVNATLPQFCAAADEAEAASPFLPTIRGCFGHSWDVWPVCLARYVADLREGERRLLAAEALLAIAGHRSPAIADAIRADHRRAEWCWAMLGDHAWNGTDEANKRHNAELRRRWSEELNELGERLTRKAWESIDLGPGDGRIAVFNSLSVPRAGLVRWECPEGAWVAATDGEKLVSQVVNEAGRRLLYAATPPVPGFGLRQLEVRNGESGEPRAGRVRATPTELESPYYQLRMDRETGGIASLVHRATGAELLVGGHDRSLCQTVYFDGQEHTLSGVTSEVVAAGPVLARVRIEGTVEGIRVSNAVTVYADLDRVDFDLRIHKPVTTHEERLCQVFPIAQARAVLRLETPAAVVRPRPQPEGDLLPGADARRFAVQGFVDASVPGGPGVTVAPLDAFVLRPDLGAVTFEALGNDQNYREVVQDQNGVTDFRFRYSLRAHAGDYDQAEALAWSRSVASPLLTAPGQLDDAPEAYPSISVDPARAIATCLKPADADQPGASALRLWEVAGRSGPIAIGVEGYTRAFETDLLEREIGEPPIRDGQVAVGLRAYGLCGLKLLP